MIVRLDTSSGIFMNPLVSMSPTAPGVVLSLGSMGHWPEGLPWKFGGWEVMQNRGVAR